MSNWEQGEWDWLSISRVGSRRSSDAKPSYARLVIDTAVHTARQMTDRTESGVRLLAVLKIASAHYATMRDE